MRPFVLFAFALAAAACSDTTGPVEARPDDLTKGIGTGIERLLGDAELGTPTDPNAASVPAAWSTWLLANAHPIRSLTSHRYDDLQVLKSILGDRRLVQLGESGHGVREFNMAKVRLIRFLHEEMGFDVIAFESGLYECWSADRAAARAMAGDVMRDCIFGVWHTAEVLALFEYIRATWSTNRPLQLAGFDIQYSSPRDTTAAQTFFDAIAGVDSAYATRVRALESDFHRDYWRVLYLGLSAQEWRDSVKAVVQRGNFTAAYDSVVAFMRVHQAAITAASPAPGVPLIAKQAAFSRGQLVRQLQAASGNVGFEIRDQGMAANIDFLMDELYPGKKVIAWAHNAHIQHDRRSMTLVNGFSTLTRSMGTWVSQRRRPELYTVGLFMYTGTAAANDRRTYTVTRPLSNSLEALFYQGRKRWLFVDMLSAPGNPGTEWMSTTTIAKEWGVTDFRLVLRNQYDGILFIHTVSPPEYR